MSGTDSTRMLGRYELLKRIAKGGMGEIYLARSRGTAGFEKNCIIKTILPHLADEEEFVTKFLDEGRIVVQLVHGNIVPVFDMGDEDGEIFIAMEYIPGRDLREVAKRLNSEGTSMPVDLALFVASEACKGLDYAHRKTDEAGQPLGIVHRDVSPSNVLISREGEVKLIDFGIARASSRVGKTVSGRIQGKFCYMSPEQASGGKVDGRSDIFSTGVLLYELLTGFRPFEGDSDLESLDLVRRCEFDAPSTLNSEVPDEVDQIVAKALAKDPADRYQTMDKFQVAMMQYLFTHGTSPTSFELAVFLSELFPEGLEREELRSARDSGSPRKPMSLDDALDFELDRMGLDETSGIDPHETTAVSSGEIVSAPGKTRTRSVPPPKVTTEEVEPVAEVEAPPATVSSAGSRSKAAVPVAILIALTLSAFGIYAMTTSSKGQRRILSEPPGAQIIVNDLVIPGAVTPHTLKLNEGQHEVRLELEGYQLAKLGIDVEAGTSEDVTPIKLKRIEEPKPPQVFRLSSDVPGTVYTLNGAVLASPVVTLTEGQVVRVKGEADGCRATTKEIVYGVSNKGFNLTPNCKPASDASDTDDPKDKPRKIVNPRVPKKKEATKEVTPTGCVIMSIANPFLADWFLDGKKVGASRGLELKVPVGRHTVRAVNKTEGYDIDHSQSVDVEPGSECAKVILNGSQL